MRFLNPELLWWLLALPLIGLAGYGTSLRARRALQRFAGGQASVERFRANVSTQRRVTKLLMLALATAGFLLAAARPQWGTRLEPVTRRGVDVVVIADTSLSMAAQDIAPDRLRQALHEVDSLLKIIEGNRVGLVTFAGQATLACPLTLDHAAVRLFLESLDVEAVQVPGTALRDALTLAVRAFRPDRQSAEERGRAIVLFTDGEDHEGGVEEVLSEIQAAGIKVYAVGCGTARGAPIPLLDRAGRSTGGYKKDRAGKVVTTRLDETLLETLARDSGGRYYRATPSEVEVGEIARALTEMDAREYGSVLRARYDERFQIPLFVALAALFAETLIGDRRRSARPPSEVT